MDLVVVFSRQLTRNVSFILRLIDVGIVKIKLLQYRDRVTVCRITGMPSRDI